MMIRLICALSLALVTYSGLSATWIERKAEGWAWYEDKPLPKDEEEESNKESEASASKQLAEIKKQLEEKLAQAIINPNTETIRAYMVEQKRWIDQSARFSELWSKILLSHPEYDQTATTPVSQYGIQTYKHLLSERKNSLIKKLSEDHGLFFFYKGSCKFSAAFSQVVRIFAEKHNWQVIAISLDGIPLKGFSTVKKDNGISKQFGVKSVPALFIVNPASQVVTPVAYGPISLDQLENNIMLQFQEEGGGQDAEK